MTPCNRCGKTNPADIHTCTPLVRTYILDGKTPVVEPDLHKWGEWFETANREVRVSHVNGALLSTVFLGLDYSWSDGPLALFETMIFGGPRDREYERYSTWDEAEAGHKKLLEELNATP